MLNKNIIKTIIINIIVFLFLIIGLDILLWIFSPVSNPRSRITVESSYIPRSFLPNQRFTFIQNEGLPGLDSISQFSTNNFGFRGDSLINPKPLNEFRIFLVGGSTTECLYIDDRKSIERSLQIKLQSQAKKPFQVRVFNAGRSGDISTDHLAMIAHRIIHLEPNVIILLSGLNDFKRSLSNYNYIQLPKTNSGNSPHQLKDLLAFNSQIFRRLILIKGAYFPNQTEFERIRYKTNYKNLASEASTLPLMLTEPKISTQYYENNLRSIIGICQSSNVKLVFVTQISTWNSKDSDEIAKYHWMITSKEGFRYNERFLEKSLNRYNDLVRGLSSAYQVDIVDIVNRIPRSEKYFYDDCHFNNLGVDLYSDIIAEFLLMQNWI